jgi:hypothetical protein
MSAARKMLMETLSGHLALLREVHPRKAATVTARRLGTCVRMSLKEPRKRMAA